MLASILSAIGCTIYLVIAVSVLLSLVRRNSGVENLALWVLIAVTALGGVLLAFKDAFAHDLLESILIMCTSCVMWRMRGRLEYRARHGGRP